MTNEELSKFINENQGDRLMDFYDKTYEKLKDLNRKIDKLSLYLIVLVFIYFVASKTTITSFSIGPVSVSDISLVSKLIPILFAWLLLDLAVTSGHKAELSTTVTFIFLSIYKQGVNPKDLDAGRFNLFARIILPFSYTSELTKFSVSKVSSFTTCLGAILFLPLILFILFPLYFEYYMLKEIYQHQYSSILGKVSFYFSLWIIIMVIYYYLNTSILAFKHKKSSVFWKIKNFYYFSGSN